MAGRIPAPRGVQCMQQLAMSHTPSPQALQVLTPVEGHGQEAPAVGPCRLDFEAAWPSGAGTAQRVQTRSRSPRRAAGTDAERGAADVDEPAATSDSEPAPGCTGGTPDTETVMVTTEGLDNAAAADAIINVRIPMDTVPPSERELVKADGGGPGA